MLKKEGEEQKREIASLKDKLEDMEVNATAKLDSNTDNDDDQTRADAKPEGLDTASLTAEMEVDRK